MALKSCNKVDINTYEIEVTVTAEAFCEAVKKAYMKQRKNLQIPGFRKGKVTQGMAEKVYGENVFFEDALEIVFPESVQAAIDETDLKIVDQPFDLDVAVMSKTEGVEMKMKVTTYPEVKLGKYKDLKAEYPETEATDEDVEAELKSMQERNSRLVSVDDRAAEMGDTAEIDFEGFVDGVAFDGGKGENFPLELGSGSFIPGFEEQVAGHKIDEEFDVNVTFPEEYEPSLAGKDAVFKCKIHEIKVRELPILDDDFAKDVDDEVETLDELKEKLNKQITERKTESAKNEFENSILESVIDEMEAVVPDCMIEQKKNELVQDYAYRMQMQGIDLNTYLQYLGQTVDQFKEQFSDSAEKQVKVALALEAIVKEEKLEANEEEIEEQAKKLAEQYDMDVEKIKELVPADQLTLDIVNKKAVDLIVDSAKKK
ncbi:MAG: trigger factor [Eubacterium sp.]|nr:trigger factor [Eubacterium sp.]